MRPTLLFLIALTFSPINVIGTLNELEVVRNERLELDLNPLHILCLPCGLVFGLVGGLVNLLSSGLVKQLGIFACSSALMVPIKARFVPNLLCTGIFEVLSMLTSGKGGGLCSLLLLCPMKKSKVKPTGQPKATPKPTKSPKFYLSADQLHEEKIFEIVQSPDHIELSPEFEAYYQELLNKVDPTLLELYNIELPAKHLLHNFMAAVEYHLLHKA